MSDVTNKDAEQDTKIAVIDSTLDNTIRRIEKVHERIDKLDEEVKELNGELSNRVKALEKWVWGAAAIITAVVVIAGIANSKEVNYGSDDTTKQEILLQLPSGEDQSSS